MATTNDDLPWGDGCVAREDGGACFYEPDPATTDEPCFCVYCDHQNPGPGIGNGKPEDQTGKESA